MFASVNFESVVAKLSLCKRRQQAPTSPIKKRTSAGSTALSRYSKPLYDSDEAEKSTDVGTSDVMELISSSTDVSDHEMPAMQVSFMMPPPGLSLPPGLDAPPGLVAPWNCSSSDGASTRLNAQAPIFVPSFATATPEAESTHLRQSVRYLKEALQQWEEEQFVAPQYEAAPVAPAEDSLLALKEALGKLGPQDACMVRSFLDAKEAGATQPTMGWNAMKRGSYQKPQQPPLSSLLFSNQSGAKTAQPRIVNRPFTPHQGPEATAARGPQCLAHKSVEAFDGADSLSEHLKDLADIDNTRVVMVRKINRLGLDSAGALEAYFAKFGTVERVMVSACRAKSTFGQTRLRPATLGFLVMSTVDEAKAVLAQADVHLVQGVQINVSIFQSHSI